MCLLFTWALIVFLSFSFFSSLLFFLKSHAGSSLLLRWELLGVPKFDEEAILKSKLFSLFKKPYCLLYSANINREEVDLLKQQKTPTCIEQ